MVRLRKWKWLAILLALVMCLGVVGTTMAQEPPADVSLAAEEGTEAAEEPPAEDEAPPESETEAPEESAEPSGEETPDEETDPEPSATAAPEDGEADHEKNTAEENKEIETPGETQAPEPTATAKIPEVTSLMAEGTEVVPFAITGGACGASAAWTFDDVTGVLTISGTGDIDNYTSAADAPWYSYRSGITSVVIDAGITKLGNYAFAGLSNMTSVAIPASATSFGSYVFEGCNFLGSATIPDGTTEIGEYMFHNCGSLNSVTLPDSVQTIGTDAFRNCGALGSITLPAGLREIKTGAFTDCDSLTGVTIPAGVTAIGNSAFMNCRALTEMTIPASVKTIGTSAFTNCVGIGDGDFTFENIDNITTLNKSDLWERCWLDQLKLSAPTLPAKPAAQGYDGSVDVSDYDDSHEGNNNSATWLTKAARWKNDEKTEAELRIDASYNALANDIDTVFTLDVSGSMGSTTNLKSNLWKTIFSTLAASEGLLNTSGYDNRVGIVAFDHAVLEELDFTGSISDVQDFLFNLVSRSGGTEHNAGLQGAYDMIQGRADKSRDAAVLFLTDGDVSGSHSAAGAIKGEGIPLAGIVYNASMNSDFINLCSPGMAYKASNADLSAVFNAVVQGLTRVYVLRDVIHPDNFDLKSGSVKVTYQDASGNEVEIPGAVTVDDASGKTTLTWQMDGTLPRTNYTVTADLDLKKDADGKYLTGDLPTNEGFAAINAVNQVESPVLVREAAVQPTPTPAPTATAAPTAQPSADPTVQPTVQPSVQPTAAATTAVQPDRPKTGDETNLMLWIVLLAAGAALLATVLVLRKRLSNR